MSIETLNPFLPEGALPFLKYWFGGHCIHIKITKNRNSKLGDYRKMPDGSHLITINGTLQPPLFFFVLTHELAHLIVREEYGDFVLPHGREWKATYRNMLIESLSVYDDDLKPIIIKYAKSPKANFMASPDLVRYFNADILSESECFLENLNFGDEFIFNKKRYIVLEKGKNSSKCRQLGNGKIYIVKNLAKVILTKL